MRLLETTDAEPEKDGTDYQKFIKDNDVVYCELLLAMKTDDNVELISQQTTASCPNGSLQKAWKALKAKYTPTDQFSLVKLMRK